MSFALLCVICTGRSQNVHLKLLNIKFRTKVDPTAQNNLTGIKVSWGEPAQRGLRLVMRGAGHTERLAPI
jgi:hypothetical protein